MINIKTFLIINIAELLGTRSETLVVLILDNNYGRCIGATRACGTSCGACKIYICKFKIVEIKGSVLFEICREYFHSKV